MTVSTPSPSERSAIRFAPRPARVAWLTWRARLAMLALAGLLAALQGATLPPFGAFDRGSFDLTQRLARLAFPPEQDYGIVIVGYDERTYEVYAERQGLWHSRYADLLNAIREGGPQTVALDTVLPKGGFAIRGDELKLADALRKLVAAVPSAFAATIAPDYSIESMDELLIAAAGQQNFGLAVWRPDDDGVVRRYSGERGVGGTHALPTLAGLLAKNAGHTLAPGVIDFSAAKPWTYVPMHDVTAAWSAGERDRLRAWFANKAVIIGDVTRTDDLRAQSLDLRAWAHDQQWFGPQSSGVLLYAQTLATLRAGGMLADATRWASLVTFVLGFVLLATHWRTALFVLVSAAVLLPVLSVIAITPRMALPWGGTLLALALCCVVRVAYDALFERRVRVRLMNQFASYVSPVVMHKLLRGQLDPNKPLEGTMAFMFADLRNSSELTRQLAPDVMVNLLNRFFSAVTEAVHAQNGMVDNFRGDGLLAVFGAPQPLSNPAQAAHDATAAFLDGLQGINLQLAAQSLPVIRVTLGLSYGHAITANIGGSERNNYTAIGDAVNRAARLQEMAKVHQFIVFCDTNFYTALNDGSKSRWTHHSTQQFRGQHEPVDVYAWKSEGG